MLETRIKIFFITACLSVVALIFCISETEKLSMLYNQQQLLLGKKMAFQKVTNKIDVNIFNPLKCAEKIFCEESNSKQLIETSIKNFAKDKILFKHKQKLDAFSTIEEIELKFTASSEREIYAFLQKIYIEINGLIFFDLLFVKKTANEKYYAEISIRVVRYEKKFQRYIRIKYLQPSTLVKNWLHIFKINRERFTLNGVIQNSIAFINQTCKRIGDEIGEYKLLEIGLDYIKLEQRNLQKIIFLGESW